MPDTTEVYDSTISKGKSAVNYVSESSSNAKKWAGKKIEEFKTRGKITEVESGDNNQTG